MYDVRAKQKLCIFIHIGSGYCCCYCIVWCCHCVVFVNVSWYFSLSIRERPIATVRICFQDKCDEYWPEPGTTTTYGHVTVTSQEEDERADFVIRTFILKVKAVRTKMELADVLSPGKQSFVYNYKNETTGTDPLSFFAPFLLLCSLSCTMSKSHLLYCHLISTRYSHMPNVTQNTSE